MPVSTQSLLAGLRFSPARLSLALPQRIGAAATESFLSGWAGRLNL
jgi:hypothetical protein